MYKIRHQTRPDGEECGEFKKEEDGRIKTVVAYVCYGVQLSNEVTKGGEEEGYWDIKT